MSDTDEIEKIRERKMEELRQREREGEGGGGSGADDGTGGAATPDDPIAVEAPEDLESLAERHEVLLVDFYADWCGPCKAMEPVVQSLAAETDAAVAKVDIDRHQGLAAEMGVRGVPTFVLYADGEPVERLVGGQDRATFERLIEAQT